MVNCLDQKFQEDLYLLTLNIYPNYYPIDKRLKRIKWARYARNLIFFFSFKKKIYELYENMIILRKHVKLLLI